MSRINLRWLVAGVVAAVAVGMVVVVVRRARSTGDAPDDPVDALEEAPADGPESALLGTPDQAAPTIA